MKPLFYLAAALSVLWLTSAAPQPLFLLNSTDIDLKDITTATFSEILSSEKTQSTEYVPTSSAEASSTNSRLSHSEPSTESVYAKDDTDYRSSTSESFERSSIEEKHDLTESKYPEITSDSSVYTFTSTGSTASKPTEDSETLNESEIPITRYVPPLDPMKHMLMMAEMKRISNLQNVPPVIRDRIEVPSSTSTSITDKPELEAVSSENSDLLEKVVETSETKSNEVFRTETSSAITTEKTTDQPLNYFEKEALEENNSKNSSEKNIVNENTVNIHVTTENTISANEADEETIYESAEKVIKDASTEKVIKDASTEKIFVDSSTEKIAEGTSTEKVITDTSTEKVITDASTETINTDVSREKITSYTSTERTVAGETPEIASDSLKKEFFEEPTKSLMKDDVAEERILDDSTEEIIKESSEVETADTSTEKIMEDSIERTTSDDAEEKSIVDESTEKINVDEITGKINEEDSSEKIVLSSPKRTDIHETSITESPEKDANTYSTVLFKSEELNEDKAIENKITTDYGTSENLLGTTEKVIILDTTTKSNDISESLALHKNADTELKAEETTTENKNEELENDNEATATIFSSTEEAILVDHNTNSDISLESISDTVTRLPTEYKDISTSRTASFKDESENLHSNINTVDKKEESIFNTFSTLSAEESTTFESTSITPKLVGEKRNVSLDDEIEFRAPKLPQDVSKVSYAENETAIPSDPEETVINSELESDISKNIFTTITNILFPSTTTEAPTDIGERHDEKTTESATERLTPETDLPLAEDKINLEGNLDSVSALSNNPADMLRVQPVPTNLDSIPARETTTINPSTNSLFVDTNNEMINPEMEINEDREQGYDIILHDNLSETTRRADTTVVTSSSREEETTQDTSRETVPPELEVKSIEDKNFEPERQNDQPTEIKSAAYLSNTKKRYVSGNNTNMVQAVQFLHYHDKASSDQCFKLVNAHWDYATNLTEENKKKQLEQTLEYSLFHKAAWKNATSFAWKSFNDTLLRRWFKSLSVLGTAALPEDKLNEFNKLKAEMKNTYSTAKICPFIHPNLTKRGHLYLERDCNLTLEPDLQRILTKSRDYEELVHVWKSWRNAAGRPIRDKYLRFVELSNEAARLNGFSDTGDMWREAYESESFEADLEELWEQLRPLYENLHAYVRRRLIQQYGADKIKENGPIPAHLFGNMWAQSWVSLLDITQPFPGKPSVDVTPIMVAKNMTPFEMFKISEEFFTSLGLKEMPEPFWKHSLIEKPKDREIICHASAWDFCNGRDYRIKQCTDITMEDLITVHHEMGHIQYFLQYARQPNVFREGANPGFHEAIGDVLALSVSTPKHLQSIGLLEDVADDPEGDLNFLLYTALDKVSFLPSGYLVDLWRWGLFSGDIKPEEMNTKWWELRLKYQGICPPVKRTDTDFDPGAKFHVPGNVPYIRYFVSFVIQFQFHKVLCDAAGHTGPLYKCDIYRSKEAGQILSQVMELGSSEHWSEAMKIMTGGATNKMDAGPILEYFQPLLDFLEEQNRNETLGWQSNDPTICP